jgi:hypothetical protein
MLGYEGYVKIGSVYALGTGTSVPRARTRIDSQGAYGGQQKTPVASIGIGAPRVYGWPTFDGSINFEITKDIFAVLKAWIYDRDGQKDILFSTRKDNEQKYVDTFWNSISISAPEGGLLDGSLGFVAIDQDTYAYGTQGMQGYTENEAGEGLLCPLATGMPPPLNASGNNCNPIPFWNSKVLFGTDALDLLSWSLDFSQDVVKFQACNYTIGPQAPAYVGVGPMTVSLSVAWMWITSNAPATYPGDSVAAATVQIADTSIGLKKLELQTSSDDVQSSDSTTPVQLEYAVYELDSP